MSGDFNEGRGTEGLEREKRAMARQIDMESIPGHWVWKGRVNRWGTPVVESMDGEVVTAAEVVHHLWKRIVPPPTFTRHCEHSLCVNPACFKTPRKRGKTKHAGPGRTAVRPAVLDTGRPGVEYCHRNHRMADTRRRTPGGVAYCGECSRIKSQERWAKELERRKEES